MKLTEREWTILSHLNMEPDPSLRVLAKNTGLKEHVVRRTLTLMADRGLVKQNCYLDPFRLGYQRVGVFFSINSSGDNVRQKLIDFIVRHEKIGYFAEVSGEWQFILSLMVRSQAEVPQFFEELSRKFGAIIGERGFEFLISIIDYQILRPGDSTANRKTVGYRHGVSKIDIDETDHQILVELSKLHSPLEPEARIARATKLPLTTVHYRIERLRENKILLGTRLMLDLEEFDFQVVLFNLTFTDHSEKVRQSLYNYLKTIWNVSFVIEYLGSFDMSIAVLVSKLSDAALIPQLLRSKLGGAISRVSSLSVLQFHKVDSYPFRDWAAVEKIRAAANT